MSQKTMEYAIADAKRRAKKKGVEDSIPDDDEAIMDRLDLTKGFIRGNIRFLSGIAYRIRHGTGEFANDGRQRPMTDDEVRGVYLEIKKPMGST